MSTSLFGSGVLTIGTVYLIFQYTEMLRRPTEQLRNEVQDLQQADASIGRIEALLATTSLRCDGPGSALPSGPLAIELDGVSFGYAPETPVLRDISICLQSGRILGVVGRTDSGKTTLMRLLTRFCDPSSVVEARERLHQCYHAALLRIIHLL